MISSATDMAALRTEVSDAIGALEVLDLQHWQIDDRRSRRACGCHGRCRPLHTVWGMAGSGVGSRATTPLLSLEAGRPGGLAREADFNNVDRQC